MNVKSAGLVFAANRKNTKSVQGTDLLNGVVGYSGLDIHVRNKVRLLMDTTYLALRTSPLKDTSVVASMGATYIWDGWCLSSVILCWGVETGEC